MQRINKRKNRRYINMIHLKNYSISGKGINIFIVNLSETKYKREELMKQMDIYTSFAKRFHTTIDEMCEIIDELCITDNSLFDYTNLITPFKVAEDYIYTRKYNPRTGNWDYTYHDIYLTYSQFWSLALNKVAHELITRRFPWLLSAPYTKKVKRYEDSIKKLPKSLKTRIRDIDCIAIHDNDLTIEDIINIYTRDGYIDSYIEKPLFYIHENGDMFLTIDADKPWGTLYILQLMTCLTRIGKRLRRNACSLSAYMMIMGNLLETSGMRATKRMPHISTMN